MALFQFIKNILKRIFPPPVKSFMREMGFLKQDHAEMTKAVNRWGTELQKRLDRMVQQNDGRLKELEVRLARQEEVLNKQNEQLERLSALFESANRENLRLYFDARAERDEIGERYERLSTELQTLTDVNNDLFGALNAELQAMTEENGFTVGKIEEDIRTHISA